MSTCHKNPCSSLLRYSVCCGSFLGFVDYRTVFHGENSVYRYFRDASTVKSSSSLIGLAFHVWIFKNYIVLLFHSSQHHGTLNSGDFIHVHAEATGNNSSVADVRIPNQLTMIKDVLKNLNYRFSVETSDWSCLLWLNKMFQRGYRNALHPQPLPIKPGWEESKSNTTDDP